MSEDKVSCLYCRLRRRRCDGREPCARCQSAGFPQWCLYHDNVRLRDKDSTVTLLQLKEDNSKLKEDLMRYKKMLETSKPQKSRFFMGLMPSNVPPFAQVGGIEGYLGSISLPSMTFGPRTNPPLVEILFDQISSDLQRHVQPIERTKAALEALEECSLATLVSAPRPNGDALIRCVLDEITTILPGKDVYDNVISLSKEKAKAGYLLGWPRLPPSIMQEIEQLVMFVPYPQLQPMESPRRLILLGINLVFLSLGAFINARLTRPMSLPKVEASIYLRYANAIIHLQTVGDDLSLQNELDTPLGTLLLYLVHLYSHYTTISNFYKRPSDVHKTVLKTRLLISRAKQQKLNCPDLQSLTTEEITLHTDLWSSIILLDVVDSFELGYHSSINPYETSPSAKTSNQQLLNDIHKIIYELSFTDGTISAESSISFFLTQITKLKKLYTSITGTTWTEFLTIESLSNWSLHSTALDNYYTSAEHIILRTIIIGLLHSLYAHCHNATLSLGETLTTSSRCKSLYVLAHKYAFASIEIVNIYKTTVYRIAIDVTNSLGHLHLLSITQFASVYESLGSSRATLWLTLRARDMCTLTNDEIMQFTLYQASDNDLDWWVFEKITTTSHVDEFMPTFDSLVDFEIDHDPMKLHKYERLTHLKVLILMLCPRFLRERGLKTLTTMNLKFMNLTKSSIMGRRTCSMGLRYCFPQQVREYENRHYEQGVRSDVTQETNSVDPSFSFDQLNSQERTVDFGALLGPTFNEVLALEESWINDISYGANIVPRSP